MIIEIKQHSFLVALKPQHMIAFKELDPRQFYIAIQRKKDSIGNDMVFLREQQHWYPYHIFVDYDLYPN